MKKLATAIAAIALIGTPAFAADIAVKAPPPAPAPVNSWTGWYVGANVGASFGRTETDYNVAPITTPSIPGFVGSAITEPFGIIGGGQIGYNWQFSPTLVAGIEADFQGADERESITLTQPFSFPIIGIVPPQSVTGTTTINYDAKIDWLGTARARIGYLWREGAVLTYLTGGLAYGKVDIQGTGGTSGIGGFSPFSITHPFGHSQVNTGWTVGFGTEGKLLIPGWTYKIEYLYVDLGSLDVNDPFVLGVTGIQIDTHTHFTDNIVRVGLNYQFR